MHGSKYRFLIIKIVMLCMIAAIVARLFNMQIIDGESYLKSASARLTTNIVNKAPRGDILDRYGNILVGNTTGYSVTMQKTTSDLPEFNNTIERLATILNDTGNSSYDTLPVSMEYPYQFYIPG